MEVTFRPSSFNSKEYQNERPKKNTKRARVPAPSLVHSPHHESIIPEFINVTDTVSLDKSSKTKVRIQVMKDYHRRRVQEIGENRHVTLDQRSEPPAISAKAQTQKFRLGQERILRPWTPKKGGKKKRQDKTPPREKSIDGDFFEQRDGKYGLNEPISRATQEWISSLEYYLESLMLHQSPSSGMLDLFGAMSLLITPRTQRLLHHYCKLLISIFSP
jgi:hypothetical protein